MSKPSGRNALRVRRFLDRRFAVVIVLLAVLSIGGGLAAYTAHVNPGEQTVEKPVSTFSVSGGYDHGATVVEQNPAFPVDTRLDDRKVYPVGVAPVLDGAYRLTYDSSAASGVSVEVDQTVTVRAIQDETVVWSDSLDSRTVTAESVASGEAVTVPVEIDVLAVKERIDRIEESLGGLPGTYEIAVETSPAISGEFNGQSDAVSRSETLTIGLDRTTYTVTTETAGLNQLEQTETETVTRERGPLMSVGGPLVVIVSLFGILGLVWARQTEKLSLTPTEVDWMEYRGDRTEFDEWITRVSLPRQSTTGAEAQTASLQDLVDISMDMDAPVMEDLNTGDFFITDGAQLYRYSPPKLAGVNHEMDSTDTQNPPADNPGRASGSGPSPIGDGGSNSTSPVTARGRATTELPPQPSFSEGPRETVTGPVFPLRDDAHTDKRGGDTETGSSTEN